MEDKNLQPLVPDMLYHHGQPEAAEPEALPLAATLPDNIPETNAPAPDAEMPTAEEPTITEETVTAENELPECDETVSAAPAVVLSVEEVEAEPTEEVVPTETEDMAAPLMTPEEAVFPDMESGDAPVSEDAPAEDLFCAPMPEEEPVLTESEPSPLEETIVPDVFQPDPAPYQPICDDDTMAWITGEVPAPPADPFAAETQSPAVTEQQPEFTDIISNEPQEEEPSVKKKNPPVKKGRPRRKKGYGFLGIPHLIATLIWLAIIVAIGSALGKLLWVGAADVLAFGRESKMVTVTIVSTDDIDDIAAKLQEAGLVKYPELFKFYAKLTGDDEEITTGTFELNTILDYHALTNALSPSSSNRTVIKVTIPEGYSCRQIFNLLASSNVCAVDALEEYAANGELSEFWFLEGVERGHKYCLEGFLFPDTYEFYVNSTPKEVLNKMLSGFNTRFDEELRLQIDTLNTNLAATMRANGKTEEEIADSLFTVREVLIVASLVEKETAGSGESATIASVIYNRLFDWGDEPAYLGIDASIYYALDGNIDPETGNTKELTSEDLKIDSPFNTRTHVGLTPTPIANPGLTSIKAALNPQSTDYYYYVLNPETNVHQFSKTREEHEKWIEKFYPRSED